MAIQGVIAPPPTPMNGSGNAVRLDAVEPLVEHLLDGGVHALFVNGTTGEGSLLELEEREALTEAFVRASGGRAPIIVQVGAPSTRASIRLAEHAAGAGAHAIAVVAPYYFAHDQVALEKHVESVARAAGIPTYIYDIPSRTQNSYGLELIRRLAERGVVVGAKDSSGDLPRMLELLGIPNFSLLPGADALALASLQAGADGMVTGPGCIFPAPYVRLWNAFRDGDLAAAAHWQRVVVRVTRAMRFGADIPLLKALLRERVPDMGAPRPPHREPPRDDVARVTAELGTIAREENLADAARVWMDA